MTVAKTLSRLLKKFTNSHDSDAEYQPTLEIRIPISPTEFFFNRIHYLAASLHLFGGPYRHAPIMVVIGDDATPYDVAATLPWSGHYNINWTWMPRELYRRDSYFATRLYRYTLPVTTDVVLMLDADTLIAAPFDDLCRRVYREQRLLGVPANVSPVRKNFTWEKLFEKAGLGPVPYHAEHSGYGCTFHNKANRLCPPYFNFGVLPMPAEHCRIIGRNIFKELEIVSELEDFFKGQMSTTLAITRNELPWGTMDFKYNFVNDERYLRRYRKDFKDVRLWHFLCKSSMDKDRMFDTYRTVEDTISRQYENKVDRKFIDLLSRVHAHVIDSS